ncbi:helix-turn-helix domain-containing protein [Streptomyces erythrochromogenes]|uniref:helix-turn-helix domain-containing protein n=1 Tax=Streptomyces erythrochromogenes TaxID=285574 RepID=UPI0038070964
MTNQDKGRRKPFISEVARELLARLHAGQRVQKGEPGLDELLARGLATWGTSALGYIATDARAAELAYNARVARDIRAALRNVGAMAALADELRATTDAPEGYGVEVIDRVEDVSVQIGRVTSGATTSVLTAHPLIRTPETLERAWPTDSALIERGLTFRTIYLDNARSRQPEQEYAAAMTAIGGEIRTALPPFERMIIVDERVVFLADPQGDPEKKGAVVVTHPSLVTTLVRFFNQQWDRAEPWNGEPRSAGSLTTPRIRRMLRRRSEGKTIKAIAAELDVSPSTLYADLNGLYAATGTASEFELGMWYATSEQARQEREKDR